VCGSNGVCVNPDTCTSNDECVSKTYCSDAGTCEADPCTAISCNRGTCAPGSGECTSKDSCTKDNELFDCVQGEKCLENECVTQENYCDQLTCEQGTCSFVDGGCVAAEDCAGDDANCLEEQFCNSDNECQRDLCEVLKVDCGDSGVCMPSVGECQNATTCESNSDCVENHLCVEGTCTLESMACGDGAGDGGCLGNQTCEYDDEDLTTQCAVPDTCTTSLDCLEGQQCGGDSCLPATTCQPDIFEPNDTDSEATDFAAASTNQQLDAELCAGDTDHYLVETSNLSPFIVRGIMTINLDYADRDVGLGEMEIELLAENEAGDFDSLDTTTTGELGSDGGATLEYQLEPTSASNYMIRVAGTNGVAEAGVAYSLSVDILDDFGTQACSDATQVDDGDIITANNNQATSTLLRHTCSPPPADGSERTERVFQFDVTESSRVTVAVTPETESDDAVVSIRSTCTSGGSEVACSNATNEGTEQIASKLLDPGTYYAIVSPAADGTLNQYDLSLSIRSAECSASSSYCADSATSEYCAGGTSLQSVTCSKDCNPTTGRCFRPDGDICATAPTLTSAGTETIKWGEVQNDYSIPSGSCLPANDGSTESDGKDQVFQVEVPDGQTMKATLQLGETDAGSLYAVTDCGNAADTCEAGSNVDGGAETVYWPNRSGSAQSVFLIADTDEASTLVETELDIEFIDLVCDPNGASATQCAPSGTAVQNCNETGTAYVTGEDCAPWACSAASCQRPDTCAQAYNLTSEARSGGFFKSDVWTDFNDDYEADSCGSVDSGDSDSWDAVFQADLLADEVLTFTMNTEDSYPQPSVYIVSSCGSADSSNCLAGEFPDESPTTVTYTATTAETVYIIADTDWTFSGQDDTWDVSATIGQACDPASYTSTCSGGTVEYCPSNGSVASYTCPTGSCNGDLCANQGADFCFPAENITAGATATGGTSISIDWSNFTSNFNADANCGITSSDVSGPDAYYAVDLVAGEVLSATLDSSGSSDSGALMVTSNCVSPEGACEVGDTDPDSSSVQYLAESDETVYLIADVDNANSTDTFTLDATVATAQCTPGSYTPTCVTADDLQYCGEYGTYQTYTCGGGCTSGACDDPTGQYCYDPIVLADTESDVQTFSGDVAIPVSEGTFGSCTFDSSNTPTGPDHIYKVELTAGETLDVDYETGINESGSSFGVMYILDTCGDLNSCLANGGEYSLSGTSTLTHTATQDGPVYVVVARTLSGGTTGYDYQVTMNIQ
ncbi:MAG: hypothetical protein ACQEVA_09840, partial [Myxococcota bacterium]